MGCSGGIVGAGAGGSGAQIALRSYSALCVVPLVMFVTRLVRLAICSCTVFIIKRNCSSLPAEDAGVGGVGARKGCAARRTHWRRSRARRSGQMEVQADLRQDGDHGAATMCRGGTREGGVCVRRRETGDVNGGDRTQRESVRAQHGLRAERGAALRCALGCESRSDTMFRLALPLYESTEGGGGNNTPCTCTCKCISVRPPSPPSLTRQRTCRV
jgi:hypothetical protein